VFESEAAVVRLAGSADEALREMDARVPDLLVIDLGLPGIDGCELLQTIRLRAPDRGGQVPALAVSAYARQADRARALAAGFRAHVPKPIDAEALVSAVLAGVPA
jgi:CheY-like chemotaxis protein